MKITINNKIYEIKAYEPISDLALDYMRLLLSGEKEEASQLILDALKSGITIKEIYLEVFQRTQREIGHLWETGQISVAKEHYCTAATQILMARLFSYVFKEQKENKTAVIACVGGELHELGARMVADFFEMDGWETYYIGANTPTDSLLSTVKAQQPDVLGISVTLRDNLPKLKEIIKRVRTELDMDHLKIIVGGHLFINSPDLWKTLEVDAYGENVEAAVTAANQLIERRDVNDD
jgi:methanogenic corrinoid protein MtbC1